MAPVGGQAGARAAPAVRAQAACAARTTGKSISVLRDRIQVIGENVFGDERDDLDDLSLREPGGAHGVEVGRR